MKTNAEGTVAGTVQERLARLLIEQFGMPADEAISSDTRMIEDLGCDSMQWLEMLMAAEEAFDVEINDAEAEEARNVGELAALIERLVG